LGSQRWAALQWAAQKSEGSPIKTPKPSYPRSFLEKTSKALLLKAKKLEIGNKSETGVCSLKISKIKTLKKIKFSIFNELSECFEKKMGL
jgi:hypothetical protein